MTITTKAFAIVVNHLLARESWAKACLSHHAGASAKLTVYPFDINVCIRDDGYLVATVPEHNSDVSIDVSLSGLVDLAVEGYPAMMRHVRIEGDAKFANTLFYLTKYLRWEIAEDLSEWVGDAAAYRITKLFRSILNDLSSKGKTTIRSFVDYLVEEEQLLITQASLRALSDEVARTRDDLARLEKRIEYLECPECLFLPSPGSVLTQT
ncbi:ubiquinone biosynthesis accessory factor UbiJ [Candidatus Pandoraea novymonadis]|uniref:Ubiquinone biosynthesis accessory factor UbiJ n=1 Tax=Candidatus Pandoraea novymonadis TaxID=1808959 RepID=A0ABX5FF49_9BURK|nr:SCP2 sterol-binding domain-containing protein [Candidatus Pandoraea novymonadis]PSB92330.1 hypothetical protein BZL35_00570 [Candidatus Pandoraea novymonadis]